VISHWASDHLTGERHSAGSPLPQRHWSAHSANQGETPMRFYESSLAAYGPMADVSRTNDPATVGGAGGSLVPGSHPEVQSCPKSMPQKKSLRTR
jgi:hypothetical protein